ncbi:MAG: T9SS type A sorting domain-containing protein, partial [Bacteroidetes bacterium]|nr:T9SS type A sorting domain-containing protein [Bacteroidota bacterium]
GTDAGVYYTWDNWDHWELHSTDLPNVIVSELEIHYPSQKLYAATFGRGIWMADLASATNGIDAIGSIETRLSVYPNPIVDGQVNIDISGMPAGLMTIDIIDIQGKIVFQEQVPASEGRFNGILNPDISPGVYFIRSWVGTTMRTTKLLFK